jgi:hypothetical protein
MTRIDIILLIIDITATLLNGICVLIVYFARRSFAQRSELNSFEQRIRDLEHGPDWDVLDEIKKDLKNVTVSLATVTGAMPAYVKTIDLMHVWLVEHAK